MNDVTIIREVIHDIERLMGNVLKYREELLSQLAYFKQLNSHSRFSITPFPTDYIERKIEIVNEIIAGEKSATRFILISGKAQNGKDTSARFAEEYLTSIGKKVLVTHYADLLKYLCKTFFEWNGEKDEKGRTLLQHVGADCIRKNDPDYWVRFVVEFISMCPYKWDYVIIPDTRYPNEIEYVKASGFPVTHVRVDRGADFDNGLTDEQKAHESENALNDVTPDYTIENYKDLESLKGVVEDVFQDIILKDRRK